MSTRKILVVDDSKSARYALRLLLQKHDYAVDTAESAESCLEMVKTDPPDAIFMDHLMPGMNGFEALEALKKDPETARIPVVMCTSNDDAAYQRDAKGRGALDTLPKPATPERLRTILKSIDKVITAPAAVGHAPAAPAPAAAAAVDREAIARLVQDEGRALLETELGPLLDKALEARLDGLLSELQSRISEQIGGQVAQQIRDGLAPELARLREEFQGPVDSQAMEEQVEARVRQLETDLASKAAEHALAASQRLGQEVLPPLIKAQAEELEGRLMGRLDQRFDELAARLTEEIPQSAGVMRRVSDAAETAAEQRSADIATARAHVIAETVASEKAGEVADTLTRSAKRAVQRMYLLATGAAAVGVLASAITYLLLS